MVKKDTAKIADDKNMEETPLVIGQDFPVRPVGFEQRLWAVTIDSIILLPMVNILIEREYQQVQSDISVDNIKTMAELWAYFVQSGGLNAALTNSIISFILMGAALIFCWHKWSTTPGKMILSMRIIDTKTLEKPTIGQFFLRYFGYFVSGLFVFIGFFWVSFDRNKRAWHDHISGTMVVYSKPEDPDQKQKTFRRQTYMAIAIAVAFLLYSLFSGN